MVKMILEITLDYFKNLKLLFKLRLMSKEINDAKNLKQFYNILIHRSNIIEHSGLGLKARDLAYDLTKPKEGIEFSKNNKNKPKYATSYDDDYIMLISEENDYCFSPRCKQCGDDQEYCGCARDSDDYDDYDEEERDIVIRNRLETIKVGVLIVIASLIAVLTMSLINFYSK